MYKVMAYLARKPGLSREEFRTYYEYSHVPLIERLIPGMTTYQRNYLNFDEPFRRNEEHIGFDMVTEMVFEDREACSAWFAAVRQPDIFRQIMDDEAHFLDQDRVMVTAVDVESYR